MRARRSERGSVLILVAVSMSVLLALAALFITIGLGYESRNKLAAAADAAARAGAFEVLRDTSLSDAALSTFGQQAMTLASASDATLDIHRCTAFGNTCDPSHQSATFVEAVVTRPVSSFLPAFLPASTFNVKAKAVAGSMSGPNCIVSLSPNDPSLTVGGTVNINMPGCNIVSNGTLDINGGIGASGDINAGSIGAGACSGAKCGTYDVGQISPVTDPLATLPTPTNPYSTPTALNVPSSGPSVVNLTPGWYSQIVLQGSKTINVAPGFYWISGPFIIANNSSITGNGVTFYLDGTTSIGSGCTGTSTYGCVNWGNSLTAQLSAPTTGTYDSILFFQARTNGATAEFGNGGSYNLSGAMYFPDANVHYGNAGASNDCTLFVAYTIDLSPQGGGTADMNFANTCYAYGGSPLMTAAMAE